MKKFAQLRFYTNGSSENSPLELNTVRLTSGEAFKEYPYIHQLGIQGIPGTTFRLNGNPNTISLGFTGIYEIQMSKDNIIGKLQFNNIIESSQQPLIIDLIYTTEL